MVIKYMYLFSIAGAILLILGIIRFITDGYFSVTVAGHFVPAFFLFYVAYKAYKGKQDDELM